MSKSYEYILSLNDKISDKMRKITGTSTDAMSKFSQLNQKTKILERSTKDFGGSISTLRQKIDLLQNERDIIDPANLKKIRQYNSEIKKLHKNVTRLETINGNKFKKLTKDAFSELPSIAKNPIVLAGAALGFGIKNALNFGNEMAKVNVTAQLDEKGLSELSEKVKSITKKNKADINLAPVGLEKIISQTGDVALSLDILNQVQRGAKGGFVDMDTVAGALVQTMSIVGKENAKASDVLDTFFAAKRVGAGEFADFARYMPNLIAGGSSLGLAYKEVAGTFAYMTGKGQSAEKSAVLMENAFSALGKSDIQKGLAKFGVQVFDSQDKMRSLVDIARDLNKVLPKAGEKDKQRGSILEQIGLRDKEAKNAFMIMTADVTKFAESMSAVKDSVGETDSAIRESANPHQKMIELWNRLKSEAVDLGDKAMPIFNLGLSAASKILDVLLPVVDSFTWIIGGVFSLLADGNPLMWGAVAGLTAYAIAVNTATIATKAKALWIGILATKTLLTTGATWLFSAALWANPITWIVAGIIALVAIIVYVCQTIRGWGSLWKGVVGFMKYSFIGFVESIRLSFSAVINGIMIGLNLIKLGWYKFKEACGIGDSSENQSAIAKINADVEARQNAIVGGVKKVAESAKAARESLSGISMTWDKEKSLSNATGILKKSLGIEVTPKLPDGISLPKGVGGSGEHIGNTPLNLNKVPSSLKGSTAYDAIASRLQRVIIPTMAAASMTAVSLLPISEASLPPIKDITTQYEPQYAQKNEAKSIVIENITIHIASASPAETAKIAEIVQIELSKILNQS